MFRRIKQSAQAFLLLVSALVLQLPFGANAQNLLPQRRGDRCKYSSFIELKKGYVSGLCIMLNEDGQLKGSIFNEFGISFMDFSYDMAKDKVKVHNVMGMMNKWYIKRVLKNDIKCLINALRNGETQYHDEKHKIKYTFTPFDDTEIENIDSE